MTKQQVIDKAAADYNPNLRLISFDLHKMIEAAMDMWADIQIKSVAEINGYMADKKHDQNIKHIHMVNNEWRCICGEYFDAG